MFMKLTFVCTAERIITTNIMITANTVTVTVIAIASTMMQLVPQSGGPKKLTVKSVSITVRWKRVCFCNFVLPDV